MSSVTRRVVSALTLGAALAGASAAPSLAATARTATGGEIPVGVNGLPTGALTRAGDLLGPAVSLLDPARLSQLGANLSTGVAQHEMGMMQNMGTHMMQGAPVQH